MKEYFEQAPKSLDDPEFFSSVFAALDREVNPPERERVSLSEGVDRSGLQESCSVRNVISARMIATNLIDEEGRFCEDQLEKHRKELKTHLYPLGPERQHDILRRHHLLDVLNQLADDPQLVKAIISFTKPFMHPVADQIIRDTLILPKKIALTDAHTRRAVLSAWLTYLRQNVGSCFATAPAIIIQQEQPHQFLSDLNELLTTGRLKRTFGGVEYAVPLSYTWGSGDLKRTWLIGKFGLTQLRNFIVSPAFQAAFKSYAIEDIEGLIDQAYRKLKGDRPFSVVTTEDIFNEILLIHFEITEQDVSDFLSRPTFAMPMDFTVQRSGKQTVIRAYLEQIELVKNHFKAFADNALLKSWEYTLASFAETKANFTRWNLYSSLGMDANQQGGIGQCMYQNIQDKIDYYKREIENLQTEYEQIYGQLKFVEGRMKNASTEKEINWLRAEYQSRLNEFRTFEEMRNDKQRRAKRLANLFNELLDLFYELFPEHFQEIYDPDLREVKVSLYDDAPAGFRLVYKHGRSNTAQWTMIQNPQQFVECLAGFFIAIEPQLVNFEEFKGLESDISELITLIVHHVKTTEFLETAFHRMASAHKTPLIKDPLKHLDRIEKKPWAYTSGGTMGGLVSCYFRLEEKPEEISRWVENPTELLVFLLDILKQIPYKQLESDQKGLLIHSPTHAFLLNPGQTPFQKGWKTDAFTYTWVRDNWIKPGVAFWEYQMLGDEEIQECLSQLLPKVHPDFRPRFKEIFNQFHDMKSVVDFRQQLVATIEQDSGLSRGREVAMERDVIDATLYQQLPLFPIDQLHNRVETVLQKIKDLPPGYQTKLQEIWLMIRERFPLKRLITSDLLLKTCKMVITLCTGQTSFKENLHMQVVRAMRDLRYLCPEPIIFADSNWVTDLFGFVVSPGSVELELWRMDVSGLNAHPLTQWNQWLDGSRKDRTWGIYPKATQYTS